MIKQLASRYQKFTAATLWMLMCLDMTMPVYASGRYQKAALHQYAKHANSYLYTGISHVTKSGGLPAGFTAPYNPFMSLPGSLQAAQLLSAGRMLTPPNGYSPEESPFIGGPSQPEMSAFKPASADNLVNLFTGDFSYNIPLMDVGGYPINIFYDGGVGMEQDASWVGLGWNINPGNINRNMRGVPDDFNGEEKLKQTQTMKPNKTWGVGLNVDLEIVGIKGLSVGASMGVSFNNYLGPALEIGAKGSYSFSLSDKAGNEKTGPQMGVGVGATLSSRNGLSISPFISLSGKAFSNDKVGEFGVGVSLSTSYNSRTGIKALQLSDQLKFNVTEAQKRPADSKRSDLEKWRDDKRDARHEWSNSTWTSTINFTKPSYNPTMRMPITNSSFDGKFQIGGAMYGIYVNGELEGYGQVSKVAEADEVQEKPMYGYLHYQNARNNSNAVMDFSRINDNEVTPETPIISAPQYAYDVFSVQGEGTGGTIRAYRNDHGYVRDNFTKSRDLSISTGFDIGIPGHYGANLNVVTTPTTSGEWNANNKLRWATGFGFSENKELTENVYFRNPGESSVLTPNQFDKIGGLSLVRFKLGTSRISPSIEPVLERFSRLGSIEGTTNMAVANTTERKKRTQVIDFLTALEASEIGLDKMIKNYSAQTLLDGSNNLVYTAIPRIDGTIRRANHISQINVTEANGSRYVYGIPVYNIQQKDFTFSVTSPASVDAEKVTVTSNELTTASPHLSAASSNTKDGYLLITETPPYAHSYLLSGILSPDYVDITNNGITEDDMGTAVKFNYTKIAQNSRWRTPMDESKANFNVGKRTEQKDDKGILSIGERESWYVHSIESKTMIAVFSLEGRADGKGVGSGTLGGLNTGDNAQKRLKKIELYSKADLKKNGLAGAKPIKTVHFTYSYALCPGAPNNNNQPELDENNVDVNSAKGKLTLESIYFTYNGQTRANKSKYVFSYTNAGQGNPAYVFNGSDRWGNYKPAADNPASLRNADYPYTIQDKTKADANAGAWMLKKILLPSGGQLEVNYEADDYAYVQNKRATAMMEVVGFGSSPSAYSNRLYTVHGYGIEESDYAFIRVAGTYANVTEMYQKFLAGIDQVAFKLAVQMPKPNLEYINAYATIAPGTNAYGLYQNNAANKIIWIKLNKVDGHSPLTLSVLEFLREQLPGQAFDGSDVSESDGAEKISNMLLGMLNGLKGAFKNPIKFFMQQGKAQLTETNKCFARLIVPDGFKYGGGYRVKSVKIKDNWKRMNSALYTSEYGQEYTYTTTENFNGTTRTISSGVASYEPSLGGDENPWQTMLQIADRVPLGPANYGAIEMPMLDAFFPAPSVGYSKVTVRSIKKGVQDPSKKSRSGVGKQVTEFYTAKDFPVKYAYTPLDLSTDLKAKQSYGIFFYHYAFNSRALSQGFLVEINDMHGKMKSQASYAENDEKTQVNYTEYFYRNTGAKGMDEKFDFVYASTGGTISSGNMGIDAELMTDTREFSVKTRSLEIQGQLDWFQLAVVALWLPFIWPVVSRGENTYRAVTTTKVVNYHSIVDSVVAIDKGSQVSTKNLVYDAETGNVIVTRTNNEFNTSVYKCNYPAYWAYSGMGLAYQNTGAKYKASFTDGLISGVPTNVFESGDELYIIDAGTPPTDNCAAAIVSSADIRKIWALDKQKNTGSLTNTSPQLIFIDASGVPYTRTNVLFRIVRSGHRNMLDAQVASFTSLTSPIMGNKFTGIKLALPTSGEEFTNLKVINATAIEFREKWQTDNEQFKRYTTTYNPANCTYTDAEDCNGLLEKKINPYVKGLLGNFKSNQSKVFYGRRKENDPATATNLPLNGFLDNFKLYWNFNASNNLVPDLTNAQWVWNSQITKLNAKGMELETKDALGIYTAAQYGFDKTLAVAITNNARVNEMANEGFEDNEYNATLNVGNDIPCIRKPVDFSNMSGSSVVNTTTLGINAHTGKYALKVNANTQAQKTISIGNPVEDSYPLQFGTSYIMNPVANAGSVNIRESKTPTLTATELSAACSTLFGSTWMAASQNWPATPNCSNLDFQETDIQYAYAPYTGSYTFNLYTTVSSAPTYPPYIENMRSVIEVILTELRTGQQTFMYADRCTDCELDHPNQSYVLNLNCGDYKIETFGRVQYFSTQGHAQTSTFGYTTTGGLETRVVTCTYTKPIPGLESMLNSMLNIPTGKKMIFSAWVKENCNTPCTAQTYTNSKVQLLFNDGSSTYFDMNPAGPIIEGWQRIEGEFTAPATATTMTVKFVNNSAQPVYFDDIRVHPFNANMKSYVYDPVNLRLRAELDANNFASFYEYDEEGTLIRVKAESREGIKTIKESRSAKQKNITTIE